MTQTSHHPVALSAGGTVDQLRESRYAHDPRVTPRGNGDGYTVDAPEAMYVIKLHPTQGWCTFGANGVDRVDVAGVGVATCFMSADTAIFVLIGEPRG